MLHMYYTMFHSYRIYKYMTKNVKWLSTNERSLEANVCRSKEYFRKVDYVRLNWLYILQKNLRNYIIRMLRCRRHTHIWNVKRYWPSNIIYFFYIERAYLAARICNICKYLKQQLFDPETVRYLLADLQLILSFSYTISWVERCDLLMWIISHYRYRQ